MESINAADVPCQAGSRSEGYLEKACDGTCARPAERLPTAHRLGETSLMFQVHPTVSAERMQRTGEIVAQVMTQAAK